MVATTITLALAAHLMETAQPTIAGVNIHLTALTGRARVPSSQGCANLTSASITSAGTTSPARKTAIFARVTIPAMGITGHHLAGMTAATNARHAVSSATIAPRAASSTRIARHATLTA